jgi:hypothetical protein
LALRQLVEHVGGLVHPAALAARAWPYLDAFCLVRNLLCCFLDLR